MPQGESYPVRIEVPVSWGDMDAFAHVNNTVYLRWFESARIAYFERMGILEPGAPSGVGPILASVSCRFKAPLAYPDTVEVSVRVTDVGDDRFTMGYAVYSRALGRTAAVGEGLNVSYDYAQGKKAALPAWWRERIEAIEGEDASPTAD
jgi:acyl-CoA thioester hydrolase